MYWLVALLVLLTSVLQAKAEPPDEQALHLLKRYRCLPKKFGRSSCVCAMRRRLLTSRVAAGRLGRLVV